VQRSIILWIDKLIINYIKKTNDKYLRFQPGRDLDLPKNSKGRKYLLYAHIPFCETLCPYCSFNRYLFEPVIAKSYFNALRQELRIYKELNYDCSGVYLGGGTPTILPDELYKTISLIKQLYSVKEVSVETNPNHLTKINIETLKQMGINRLSVGVQSFNDSLLKSIERYHKYGSGSEIKEALKLAGDNFNTVNVDMIFNFPSQTQEMLNEDIDSIIQLGVNQVTFYPLMPAKAITGKLSGALGKIDYQKEKLFYSKILEKLSGHLEPSTVWCFSRNKNMTDEYIIEHDEYLGTGSGAFGFLNGYIFSNTFSLQEYIRVLKNGKLPIAFSRKFRIKELMRYDFLMKLFGMRLNIKELNEKYSGRFYHSMWKEIAFFKTIGAVAKKGNDLSLTKKGMYYWLIMMREFFTSVNNFREYCRNETL